MSYNIVQDDGKLLKIAGKGEDGDKSIELTQAQYDLLVENDEVEEDVNYFIKDAVDDDSVDSINTVIDISEHILDNNGFINDLGEFIEHPAWYSTDFIEAKPNDKICVSINNCTNSLPIYACYDKNKNFLMSYRHSNQAYWQLATSCVITHPDTAYIKVNTYCNRWQKIDDAFLLIVRNRRNEDRYSITCDKNATKDIFTTNTLYQALLKSYALGNCDVLIKTGNYDLMEELTNPDGSYIETAAEGNNGVCIGLRVGKNNTYTFETGAKIVAIVPAGKSTRYTDLFSAIHIAGSCKLNNMNIVVQNCRYCVHDDMPSYMRGFELDEVKGAIVEFNNCVMEHLGTDSTSYIAPCCIGGGTYLFTKHLIIGGYYKNVFEQYPAVISYHNNSDTNSEEEVVYRDIYCADNCILQLYGFSENGSKLKAYIVGCKMTAPYRITGHEDRIKLYATTFENVAYNEYKNWTGGFYNGKPVYIKTITNRIKDDTNWWVMDGQLTNVQSILELDAYEIFDDVGTSNLKYWSIHSETNNSLEVRVSADGLINILSKNEYKYSVANALVRVVVKYIEI